MSVGGEESSRTVSPAPLPVVMEDGCIAATGSLHHFQQILRSLLDADTIHTFE